MNQPNRIANRPITAIAIAHAATILFANGTTRMSTGSANPSATPSANNSAACAAMSTMTARNRLPSPASS